MNYKDPVLSRITFHWEHQDQQSVVHPCVRKYDSWKFVISNIDANQTNLHRAQPKLSGRRKDKLRYIEVAVLYC